MDKSHATIPLTPH